MTLARRTRGATRLALLDRSLEEVPLFRLSDAVDDGAVSFVAEDGARWRVLPAADDRLPGTFDQDVYVELMQRMCEAAYPSDGRLTFTLHAFLRSMGRRVDGRTYEQLRGALARLERTSIEVTPPPPSEGSPEIAAEVRRITVLSSVAIERRRATDHDQLTLFPGATSGEPGVARVIVSPWIVEHLAADNTVQMSVHAYLTLPSPVARRLYRLIEVARSGGAVAWRVGLDRLRDQLPLTQRFPSHLQRVLEPAHLMLKEAGIVRSATVRQQQREWFVDYVLAPRVR